MQNSKGPPRRAESMKNLPQMEGMNLSAELESGQSSSIFNSENDRPVSVSLESIPRTPPPIDSRLRMSLSKQIERRESAMKDEGPAQWSLVRAEQVGVAQRVMGASTSDVNLHYHLDGAVN